MFTNIAMLYGLPGGNQVDGLPPASSASSKSTTDEGTTDEVPSVKNPLTTFQVNRVRKLKILGDHTLTFNKTQLPLNIRV